MPIDAVHEAFKRVQRTIETVSTELSRDDYRELLDRLEGEVRAYIDCWDEEEGEEATDGR